MSEEVTIGKFKNWLKEKAHKSAVRSFVYDAERKAQKLYREFDMGKAIGVDTESRSEEPVYGGYLRNYLAYYLAGYFVEHFEPAPHMKEGLQILRNHAESVNTDIRQRAFQPEVTGDFLNRLRTFASNVSNIYSNNSNTNIRNENMSRALSDAPKIPRVPRI